MTDMNEYVRITPEHRQFQGQVHYTVQLTGTLEFGPGGNDLWADSPEEAQRRTQQIVRDYLKRMLGYEECEITTSIGEVLETGE